MGRTITNPRTCTACKDFFDWRTYGVIWDVHTDKGLWTIELCMDCARKLVGEIHSQNEELIVDEMV
jgi:hypothetical protein